MTQPANEDKIWLVYSRPHDAFWGPDNAGYFPLVKDAGRYTKEAAEKACKSRSCPDPENPPEVMVLAPEAADTIDQLRKELKAALWYYATFRDKSPKGPTEVADILEACELAGIPSPEPPIRYAGQCRRCGHITESTKHGEVACKWGGCNGTVMAIAQRR